MPANLIKPVDFAEFTLATDLNAGVTTGLTVVEDIAGLEAQGWVVVVDENNGDEVIYYSGKDDGAKTLSGLTRAIAGSDAAHASGKAVLLATSAQYVVQLIERINTISDADYALNPRSLTLADETEVTIASGAVTVDQARHTVDTEADAAVDDLNAINGGSAGQWLILRAESPARMVTVRHGAGNIVTSNARDAVLDANRQLVLCFDGANWRALGDLAPVVVGRHTIWAPAGAMRPTVSNGCAPLAEAETSAGRPDISALGFDANADEHAQFQIAMPKSWNGGAVTFQAFWTSAATDTGGVAWGLQAVAVADGDAIDVAYGAPVVVGDNAQGAAQDIYVSAESSAVLIAGSPGANELVVFRVFRDVSDPADTMSEDARLIGLKIFFTTDAETDD